MAGIERFELSQTESKSVVLPLHNIPSAKSILAQRAPFVNKKIKTRGAVRLPGIYQYCLPQTTMCFAGFPQKKTNIT